MREHNNDDTTTPPTTLCSAAQLAYSSCRSLIASQSPSLATANTTISTEECDLFDEKHVPTDDMLQYCCMYRSVFKCIQTQISWQALFISPPSLNLVLGLQPSSLVHHLSTLSVVCIGTYLCLLDLHILVFVHVIIPTMVAFAAPAKLYCTINIVEPGAPENF